MFKMTKFFVWNEIAQSIWANEGKYNEVDVFYSGYINVIFLLSYLWVEVKCQWMHS